MLNVTTETEPTDVGTLHVSVGLYEKINHTLRSFWEIESIGIMNEKESLKSNEEALQLFEKTVQFKEERYEVRLPWKNEDHDLPSNYNVAKRRFDQLVKKFQNNVPLYEK